VDFSGKLNATDALSTIMF